MHRETDLGMAEGSGSLRTAIRPIFRGKAPLPLLLDQRQRIVFAHGDALCS